MSFSDFVGSLLGGGSSSGNNANYIGGSDLGGYTGSGNNQNTYGPYGNLSQSEYRSQYGGRDSTPMQRRGGQEDGQGTAKAKPKTIDELMAEFDVSQYVPTGPATSYLPFYNAIPLDYSNTMGPQSAASQMDIGQMVQQSLAPQVVSPRPSPMGMDIGQMVQQSLLAAPQPSMPAGILGPSMQTQTPLTAPISYEDFLRYYRGGV